MSDPTPAGGPADPPMDTTVRTLQRAGSGPYRTLVAGPGEPHRVRADLLSSEAVSQTSVGRVRLASLLHLTDFQIADLVSPSRVEYLQRLAGETVWQRMLPAVRPQEFLLDHAVEAVVRTVRRLAARSDDGSGADRGVDLVVTTGDNTDSAQRNELERYLTLMSGGPVQPMNGELAETVTASGDPHYWNPEPNSGGHWSTERGLPEHAGVLAAATREFTARGLGVPWLTCFGNHDCLVQGRAAAPADYDEFLTADRKPVALADDPPPTSDALELYCADPRRYSTGPSIAITPSAQRRLVEKQEWMEHHFRTGGEPPGHGFTEENLTAATTWYAYDEIPGVRVIGLDTTNPAGHVDGCLGRTQLAWLVDRLAEVHATHLDADGTVVTTGRADRLVVLCSHHGLSTMTNDFGDGTRDGTPALADEIEAVLHRFGNVVLWLSGHTHVNRVTPRPAPAGSGFWEISTSSIAEWPVQLRQVDLELVPGVGVAIRSTVVDSDAPAAPTDPDGAEPPDWTLERLAALHREVAANDDGSVGGLHAEGEKSDRNVELLVPLPAAVVASLTDTLTATTPPRTHVAP